MLKDDYLERLKKTRQVYVDAKHVCDVSTEQAFIGAINHIADYYSLQEKDPQLFSYSDNGNTYHISTLAPTSHSDLKRKRDSYKAVADLSFGMLGRTPDFMNSALAAMAKNAQVLGADNFANYADNAQQYYEKCRGHHLYIGHGAINPQLDRQYSLGKQENNYCGVRVVATDKQGITVSGAKMIVTLAPIADELLIFNMPGLLPGDEDFALAFAIPVTSPNIKIICRKSLQHRDYQLFDHPIANLFDESDAYLIFHEAFIPWQDVFVFRDVEKSNAFYDQTKIRNHNGHQGIVRALSKAEFLTAVSIELAEKLQLTEFMNIRAQLGQMTSCLELIRGGILLAEQDGFLENGLYNPSLHPIQAVRCYFPQWYQKMVITIQSLAAGSMLSTPHQGDFNNENAAILHSSMQTENLNASERVFLLNLAWDLSGDGFGQRQLVYEKYHAGDPLRIAAMHYVNYPKENLALHFNKIKRIYRDSLCKPNLF